MTGNSSGYSSAVSALMKSLPCSASGGFAERDPLRLRRAPADSALFAARRVLSRPGSAMGMEKEWGDRMVGDRTRLTGRMFAVLAAWDLPRSAMVQPDRGAHSPGGGYSGIGLPGAPGPSQVADAGNPALTAPVEVTTKA